MFGFLSENLSEIGLPIVKNVFALQANDEITTGVDVLGSYQLRPDLSTLRSVSFAEGQAYVMGRFFCGMDGRGGESDLCPRTILQRVVEKAEKDLGVRFMVQFVTSFLLMEQGGAPASTGAWATSRKLGCNAVGRCIHEVAGNILDAGIELETYCDEGVDGQGKITSETEDIGRSMIYNSWYRIPYPPFCS
ncbi:unnamed protein product [Rhizoctonia solani]|uniref:Uncharacterized protein n=1 Tax=Rhizoctonia solani TaxID=456999 RepID=A0A8H2W9Z6_9AGAM|nr:unnamed protein product [Rhizoctonia solani]